MKKVEVVVLLLVAALCAGPALAVEGWQQVATPSTGSTTIDWQPQADAAGYVLTVSAPDGTVVRREFKAREVPSFSVFDANGQVRADGTYTYELRAVPQIDKATRQQLRAAREAGDEAAVIAELQKAGRIPAEALVQSGSFAIAGGAFVSGDAAEPRYTGSRPAKAVRDPNQAGFKDQVIPDDLIVQGSLCVGFDCVNNESFGFDTIRLKENNTRIKFEDTSVGTFPTNDWQLTANDSASGGQSKLSIEDITGARVPFTVEAGATTNSIYVDSTGRVGLRTSTPVLDLHIATSNTPAIRLEQNNSGGFTAQTWDIAGNEANFFVRDVTGGSRLPFRIRPGAPTSSVDISADGDVGIGTGSPAAKLHVSSGETRLDSADATLNTHFNFTGNGQNYLRGTTIIGDIAGNNVGIGCDGPGFDLVVGGTTANCATAPFSHINAGDSNWVGSSSRAVKENLATVESRDILEKIAGVGVYTYDFINGSKDRMGLMAEDFHQVFNRGSDKMLDSGEVQMALWLGLQELTARNEQLSATNSELEKRLEALERALQTGNSDR